MPVAGFLVGDFFAIYVTRIDQSTGQITGQADRFTTFGSYASCHYGAICYGSSYLIFQVYFTAVDNFFFVVAGLLSITVVVLV